MYGESIPMYMKRRRMDEAAVLLATTNMTVGEIAIGVGYENQSKFASAFKSLKKMTPLEYRRMSRVDGFTASCY
jgi:AraC-like DNA-binding protein